MRMKHLKKSLSFFLCAVLIVAMALSATGCSDNTDSNSTYETETAAESENPATDNSNADASESADAQVLGEGDTKFLFTAVDPDGNETVYEIHTDQTIVGEALQELELISGEEGEYGLYVTTVNGVTLDYDSDGMYWAFYINGEYAQTGVDLTEITEGDSYSFQAEQQ